jgi:glycosyltransferase involved in cell wall biosynthesis
MLQPKTQARPRNVPLKIDFIVTSLPVGGAELLLLNLVRGMDRANFEPRVVCLKEAGALESSFAQEVPVLSRLLVSKWDCSVLFRLMHHFRSRRTDVVITVGAGDKMFWGRLAARLAGVPVICSALHSTGWPDGVGRLNRMLTPLTTGFIACAEGHAEYLTTGEGFPFEKVFMVRNGVDVDRFKPNPAMREWLRKELRIPAGSSLVGIVAALRPEKNHLQFVRAGRDVVRQHSDAHFVIVGEGPERAAIEAEIQRLEVRSNFHLLGNRSDTQTILAGLDVFCLTSRNEANPVSILEALACGVPAVSPDVGSIRETVRHQATGLLTKPLCAASTADAVMQLIGNPSTAQRMGRAGRELVVANFSLQVMVRGYEDLAGSLYNAWAKRRCHPQWHRRPCQCGTCRHPMNSLDASPLLTAAPELMNEGDSESVVSSNGEPLCQRTADSRAEETCC